MVSHYQISIIVFIFLGTWSSNWAHFFPRQIQVKSRSWLVANIQAPCIITMMLAFVYILFVGHSISGAAINYRREWRNVAAVAFKEPLSADEECSIRVHDILLSKCKMASCNWHIARLFHHTYASCRNLEGLRGAKGPP